MTARNCRSCRNELALLLEGSGLVVGTLYVAADAMLTGQQREQSDVN